jgi:hypothetical protein
MKFLKLLPSPLPSTSAEQTEEELLDRLMRITRSRHRALKAELETARLLPRQDARGKTRGRKGTIRAGDWDTKKWEWLGDCAQSLYDYLAPHIRPERKSRGLYTERVLTVIAELLNAAYSLDPGLDAHAIKTRLQSRRKKP